MGAEEAATPGGIDRARTPDGRFLTVVALALFLLVAILSAVRPPLADPDEGRNAEVACEMRAAGEWIVPSFHGLPYLDKPALLFDLIRLSYSLFGRRDFAARFPSILFAVGTLAVTGFLARDTCGPRRGMKAVAVLATAPLFVVFSRTVTFDMALTFFVTLAIWWGEAGRRGDRLLGILAWGAIAFAVFTKGPVGLLLPLLGMIALAIGSGRPYRIERLFPPLGIALFAACIAPWLWAVETRAPGFLRYALLVETLERLTKPTFHRTGPFWYYGPILLLGLFPWSIPALARSSGWLSGVRRGALRRPSTDRGFLVAFAAIFIFFSVSRSKLGGYILPALPLAAILVAGEMENMRRHMRAWTLLSAPILVAMGLASLVLSRNGVLVASWMRQPREAVAAVAQLFFMIGIVSTAVGALIVLRARREEAVPFPFAVAFPAIVLLSLGPITRYAEENSSKRIAEVVRTNGGEAVAIRCFPTGLDYYLNRVVPVVTESGREITSTYVERNYNQIIGSGGAPGLWSQADLERRLRSPAIETCVLITRHDDSPAPGFHVIDSVGRYRIWAIEDGRRSDALLQDRY